MNNENQNITPHAIFGVMFVILLFVGVIATWMVGMPILEAGASSLPVAQ